MKKTLSLSLLVATMLTSAHAQNQFTLESIDVVAAHGTSVKKKDLTDSVTIITKEALEEARITNLAEALSKLGNLTVKQAGGLGQQTSVFVRGMNSEKTLVLIDGVRYNSYSGFGAQYDQIMLFNVEQIEIIKGAQSGVWGADASAGVINIITQKAKKGFSATGNVEYGSFDTKTISLQTAYGTENFDILVGGSLLHTDGFSAVEPTKSSVDYGKRYDELGYEKDSYKNKSFNAKLGVNITENDRIEFGVQTIDSDLDYDGSHPTTYLPIDSSIEHAKIKNRFYTFAYKHKDDINDITYQHNRSTFVRNDNNKITQGSIEEVKIDDKISYLENSFFRFGASYQKFEYENIKNNNDKNYNAKSIFITNYNKLELFDYTPTILTESLRYDRYSDFKNALTGKIGLKQFFYKDIYISLNGGTGYNAPTLTQLYGQWGANPDLKPEKTRTFDITLGNDVVWATAFRNEVRDLIDWVGVWPAPSKYEQVDGKAVFKGFELGYKDIFFSQIGIEALYSYVDTKDKDNKALAQRPKQQLDTKAIWYISDSFDIGANAQYIGERYEGTNKTGAQTGRYIVAGAVANLKTNDYLTVYAKANNITDKYYQVVDGYATEGRSFYVGLNARY